MTAPRTPEPLDDAALLNELVIAQHAFLGNPHPDEARVRWETLVASREAVLARFRELREALEKAARDSARRAWMDSNVCAFTTRDADGHEITFCDGDGDWCVSEMVDSLAACLDAMPDEVVP